MHSPDYSVLQPSSPVHFCFLNPAWTPDWFWLPTAHAVAKSGANYAIPPLIRDVVDVGIEQNVDIIESTMQNASAQHIVALSRGVEYALRYLDRMDKKGRLQHVVGWTVISSAGPKGHETGLQGFSTTPDRHTQDYLAGITLDYSGLEVIDPKVARECMLYDMDDTRLSHQIIGNLTKARPLTAAEIERVPYIDPEKVPLTWYIGKNDKVDVPAVSAAIARQIFRVEPIITDWGHVGPLTHTDQVAAALLLDAQNASFIKKDIP